MKIHCLLRDIFFKVVLVGFVWPLASINVWNSTLKYNRFVDWAWKPILGNFRPVLPHMDVKYSAANWETVHHITDASVISYVTQQQFHIRNV